MTTKDREAPYERDPVGISGLVVGIRRILREISRDVNSKIKSVNNYLLRKKIGMSLEASFTTKDFLVAIVVVVMVFLLLLFLLSMLLLLPLDGVVVIVLMVVVIVR